MNKIKDKITIENVLIFFVISLPILDIISFLFRNKYSTNISPTTFLRPIIPAVIFIVIFFKSKVKFKIKMILISFLYLLYCIAHLLIFKTFNTQISFGTIIHEAKYLINYLFSIIILFIFMFNFYKKDLSKLKKCISITLLIYILSIYLSMITNTYSHTYVEGTGIKGWFESGNSLGATLILGVFLLYSIILDNKTSKILYGLIGLIGVFLLFFIGTRVGMFGFIVATLSFVLSVIIVKIKERSNISKKKVIGFITACVIVLILFITFGSTTLNRRKYLQTVNSNIIDENTNKEISVTIDIANIVKAINNSEYDEKYISKPASNAILKLYDFANMHNIKSTDKRMQQLVYNFYLVGYQKSVPGILFGNGLLNNYSELVLEMEIPAFLFNFGIFGFLLFFTPYFSIFIYCAIIGIKNIKKIDSQYIMLMLGTLFAYALSFLTGVTFFNIASATMLTFIELLLLNKSINLKEGNH